jgi:hypothetical protein
LSSRKIEIIPTRIGQVEMTILEIPLSAMNLPANREQYVTDY